MIEERRTEVFADRDATLVAGKRISWAAVFAGVIVTLVVQLMLSILGISIGASTINPLTEQNPADGIGIGAGIWVVVSSLIALFAGGWVAGHLAGVPRHTDGLLHGVLTWGLATLLTFYLLTTTIGGLISGTAGVLGRGMSVVATAAGPEAAAAARERVDDLTAGVRTDVSEGQARQVAAQTASGVATAAGWTFVVMLLSAAAAAGGGYLATPRHRGTRTTVTTV